MIQELLNALRLPREKDTIALPQGTKLIPSALFSYTESPNGHIAAESIDGLLDYLERYLTDETVIFASLAAMQIAAVFDWHKAEICGWGDHSATFKLEHTKEWRDWIGISGRPLTQVAFAEFVEEHLDQIAEPKAADVLTVATSLSGMRKVNFTNAVKLGNGDTSLAWEETTDAKAAGDVRVPSGLKLRIPVFKGAEDVTTFEVSGLFRYRINEGKLSFEVKLLHVENIAELAFEQIIKNLRESISDLSPVPPVINGSVREYPRSIVSKSIHTA